MPPAFVGLDLAGDETGFPFEEPFADLFVAARSAGLGITVHAGEFGGSQHIWRAIDVLGATRIGHGLSAVGDKSLLRRLAAEKILMEVSLTSNSYLGAVGDGSRHPITTFAEQGVPFSLNTDVPLHSGATLADECEAARSALGLSVEEVRSIQDVARGFAFIK